MTSESSCSCVRLAGGVLVAVLLNVCIYFLPNTSSPEDALNQSASPFISSLPNKNYSNQYSIDQVSTATNDGLGQHINSNTQKHLASQDSAKVEPSRPSMSRSKQVSNLSSLDGFPMLWDTYRLKNNSLFGYQRLRWPCSKLYQGPHVHSGVKVYVYETPRKMQQELHDYIKSRQDKNKWSSNWDWEKPLFQLFRNSSMRTYDPKQASFFVVPLLVGTLSYGGKLLSSLHNLDSWLSSVGPYWKRNGGADHIFTSHVCNRKFQIIPSLRRQCGPIIACCSAKEIPGFNTMVVPYHVSESQFRLNVRSDLESRHISVYFAGSLISTRKSLKQGYPSWAPPRKPVVDAIRSVPGGQTSLLERGSWDPMALRKLVEEIQYNMSHAVFTLVPHGDTPDSNRVFQAIAVGSVPLFTTGRIVTGLPFSDILDWSKFSLLVDMDDILLYRSGNKSRTYQNTEKLRAEVLARFVTELSAVSPAHKQALLTNVAHMREAFRFGPGGCQLERTIAASLEMRGKVVGYSRDSDATRN